MRTGLQAGETRAPVRIEFDGADRVRLARVLRAILAPRPWRMDAADEIKAGVDMLRRLERHLAFADAVIVIAHARLVTTAAAARPRSSHRRHRVRPFSPSHRSCCCSNR